MDSSDSPCWEEENVDFDQVESKYRKVCLELEANMSMEEMLADVRFLQEAFGRVRCNELGLQRACDRLRGRLAADEEQVRAAAAQAAAAQRSVLDMRTAMENAFRMVDEAHDREQEAQEALATAERQIQLLKTDIEQTNQAALEREECGMAPKSKEGQKLDMENLDREVVDLKTKLAQVTSAHDELERKNMATGAKMDTMAQHLEVLSTELGKEIRLRESLELQQTNFSSVLAEKEDEIKRLRLQLESVDSLAVKNEVLEAESKTCAEKMRHELETVATKASRAQQDYEAQLIRVERLARESSQKSAALKAKEEEVQRVKQEAARFIKNQDSHFKRLAAMEAVRTESERHKEELRGQIGEREREAERLRKQAEALKKKLDVANREKELLAKSTSKAAGMLEQQVEKTKRMEQMEKTLRAQLEERDQELSKQKALLQQMERECKKLQTEFNQKGEQCEVTCEELKEEQEQRLLAKRQMMKLAFEQQKENTLLETLRYEKENCERQLVASKARVERLEEKIQDMEMKGVQLKESILAHETNKMKDELVLQKAEREKESARHELRQVREQLVTFRERALTAEQEQKKLQDELNSMSKQKEAVGEDLQKINEDQAQLRKKLQLKEEEVRHLRLQIKELEKEFRRANIQYDLRVEEIKALRLKIQDLTNEKRLIAQDLTTRDDNRQQIFRLQRDLTEEQLKRKALEDELAQPRNIHRWRYLQGEDPEKFELIQRLSLVQKRLIYGLGGKASKSQSSDQERRLAVRSAPPTAFSAAEMLFQLRQSQKQIKGLLAEKMMYQSQADDLRQQVHQLGLQLQESKKKLFAQKKRLRKSAKPVKPDDSAAALQPVQRVRFTGGGFNLNVTPQDSRLSD